MIQIKHIFWASVGLGLILIGMSLYVLGFSHGQEKHRDVIQQEVNYAIISSKKSTLWVLQKIEDAKKEIEKAKAKNDDCKNVLNFNVRSCFN